MTSLDPSLTKFRASAGRVSETWMRVGRWVQANGLDARSIILRLPGGERFLAGFDRDWARLRNAAGHTSTVWGRFWQWINSFMPKGLYARSLLIIIAPMVILQSVVAFVFMERHWDNVTRHLSAAVVQDIAAVIDIYKFYPQDADQTQLRRIAQERLGLVVDFLPLTQMPPPGPKPFFSLLDQALSVELRKQIGRPFWIDTVGRSALVEIRLQLDNAVMRVFARRSAAYASNSGIFLWWMVGTSSVLIAVAILFLRNQIRPVLRLADAAESFGKGRDDPDFRPRGAREVRRAAHAFLEMKRRIERAMEQRTAMLAGVSHDLRTILTRFKLELVLIGDTPEVEALRRDVDEMARMLEDYLAFARGDSGEQAAPTDMSAFLEELKLDTERNGHRTDMEFHGYPIVTVKPAAFKRCLANLVSNAARFAGSIAITGHRDHRWMTVTVDDDGPGIPAAMREEVFKPFMRLDDARNQDQGGTGLGLAIARDIARSHGGDISLGDSPLGGLRATVRVPV
jgi:two-component system osmolarity sensor histidine kinase EnvZ